jgi:hypothetical protein
MIKFRISKKTDNIWYVTFPSVPEQNVTMLRFQEVYESPNLEFRDKPFTREQYYLWYAQTYGKMSYYTDWSGFNLTMKCINKVRDEFLDLWDCERDFADALRKKGATNDDYVICCKKGDVSAMTHEFAHGLFFTNPKYKKEVMKVIGTIPKLTQDKITNTLLKNGYAEDVILDETQAYIIDALFESFDFDFDEIEEKFLEKMREKLRKILKKYE